MPWIKPLFDFWKPTRKRASAPKPALRMREDEKPRRPRAAQPRRTP